MKSYADLYSLIKQIIAQDQGISRSGVAVSSGPGLSFAEQRALESLSESATSRISQGLVVIATSPPSMSVNISYGYGYANGRRVELAEDKSVTLPTGEAIWYVIADIGISISKDLSQTGLILAKIILPAGAQRIVQDEASAEGPDGYIVSGTYVYNSQKYDPSDPAFRGAIASALPDIFAENIFGTLKLSENLKITNTLGTMEAKSDGIRFKDTEGRILAEYLSTRARVAGWDITPGTLKSSTNTIILDSSKSQIQVGASQGILIDGPRESVGTSDFVSGPLGRGWRITPQEAEFQNARIRGVFSTSVFKKDTISASNAINIWSNSTVLKADLGSGDTTTITVEDPVFASGDRVRLKDGFDDEWILISSAASANGNYWDYTVTRDYAGSYSSGNPAWKIGTAIVSFGNWSGSVGTGFLMADAASQYSPYLDTYVRTGPGVSNYGLKARLGRLDGITDPVFGNLSGYGLYSENAYLRGKMEIGVGSTGYYNLSDIPEGIYQIFYQAAAPSTGMVVGDYWIDSDDNQLYRYDASLAWLSAQDDSIAQALLDAADAQATADGKVITFIQATAPTAAAIGDIWFNTSDYNKLYRWSGVAWVIANAADVTQTIIDGGLITTGYITLANGGNIKSGQTAFNTGVGFWAGNVAGITKFSFGNSGGNYISWDGSQLTIAGTVSIVGGNLVKENDAMTRLSGRYASNIAYSGDITVESLKPTQAGADVTSSNTSYDTARVNGTLASTVQGGAARANTGLDSSGNVLTKILPASTIGTPASAGLYLGSDYLGYYNGGWKSVITNTGQFYFGGGILSAPGTDNYVYWNGTTLAIRGDLIADDIMAGGTITGNTIRTAASPNPRIELSQDTRKAKWFTNATTVIASVGLYDESDYAAVYGMNPTSGEVNGTYYGSYSYVPNDIYYASGLRSGIAVGGSSVYGIGGRFYGGRGNIQLPYTSYSPSGIMGNPTTLTGAPVNTLVSSNVGSLHYNQAGGAWSKIPFGVFGEVEANGAINKGTGFTVTKGTTGQYTINFSSAMATAPIVTATVFGSPSEGAVSAKASAISTSAVGITIRDESTFYDRPFGFFAIVP